MIDGPLIRILNLVKEQIRQRSRKEFSRQKEERLQMSQDGNDLATFKNINNVSVARDEGIEEEDRKNDNINLVNLALKTRVSYVDLETMRVKGGVRVT